MTSEDARNRAITAPIRRAKLAGLPLYLLACRLNAFADGRNRASQANPHSGIAEQCFYVCTELLKLKGNFGQPIRAFAIE